MGRLGNLKSDIALARDVFVTRSDPVNLIHFVTNKCNARCPFCFIAHDEPETYRDELSLEEIARLARKMGPNLRTLSLTGGEPFLRPDIIDITRCYLRHTRVDSVFHTTNGSFPNRISDYVTTLKSEFPEAKLFFTFSIDAFPEDHDRIRRVPGLFQKAMASYRLVNELSGVDSANVGITVSPYNLGQVLEIYETLIEEYGVKAITACIARDEGVYAVPPEEKKRVLEAYTALTRRIMSDWRTGRLRGWDQSSLLGAFVNRKNRILFDLIRDIYLEPKFHGYCLAGGLLGVMAPDGTVYPCEMLDKPFGNVRDYGYDFMALWSGPQAQEIRAWIRRTKCTCPWECIWSFNIFSSLRYMPQFLGAALAVPFRRLGRDG